MLRAPRTLLFLGIALHLGPVPASSADVSLTRGPYLQSTTTSSVLVIWKQLPATEAVLEYGESLAYGSSASAAADTLQVLALGGLRTATRYYYRIVAAGQQIAGGEECWFETAPDSGGVRALIFGDSGAGTQAQIATARRINSLAADLVLHVGDVVYSAGEAKYYDSRFFRPHQEMLRHTPIFPTLGNHDVISAAGQPYLDAFYLPTGSYDGSERNYSFDWGDAHFVTVNTNSVSSALAAWVEADLAASTKRWKFVWYHHAAYSCGWHGSNTSVQSLLVPVFEAQHVDMVFQGHDHDYQRTWPIVSQQARNQASDPDYVNPDGPIYIVTGGGSGVRATSNSCWFTRLAVSSNHVTRMQIAGELLDLESIDSTGTRLDHMTIRKTATPAAPFVQLLSGNGRERWRCGRTYTITWGASGIGTSLDVELSRDGGSTFESIALGIQNTGAFAWTPLGSGGSDCRLRLRGVRADRTAAPVEDVSDAPLVIEPEESPGEGEIVRAFNFQSLVQTAPAGFVADTGGLYTPERGYGWTTWVSTVSRGLASDPLLDGNAYVANASVPAQWICDLPNGSYQVSLAAGDPARAGEHTVRICGQALLDRVATAVGAFALVTDEPIEVTDRRLSLTMGGTGSTSRTSVCDLVVRRANASVLTARAQASPRIGEAPLAVEFTGSAFTPGSTLVSASWSFGDGDSASTASATHTYASAGTWVARFTVVDDRGSRAGDSCVVVVSAAAAPRLALSATPSSGDAPLAVSFAAQVADASEIVSTRWSFGDGDSAATAGATHTYTSAGTWMARFRATDARGLSSEDSLQISVQVPPNVLTVAKVNFQPSSFPVPSGYTADTGALYSAVLGYGWDVRLSTEAKTTNTDPRLNTYVLVSNPAAAVWQLATGNGSFSVGLAVGSPTFTGLHRVEVEGAVVVNDVLTDANQFYTVTDCRTNVSDGLLSVRIGGIAGSTKKTKLCYITVQRLTSDTPGNSNPVASASATPVSGSAPLAVQFASSATDADGDSLAFAWSFGDGGSASVPNPSHAYTTPGTYAAIVTVTDGAGGLARDTVSVQVNAPGNLAPSAQAAATPTSGPAPLVVGFSGSGADPEGGSVGWLWSFGDGESAATQNPSHTYAAAGSYAAVLCVSDSLDMVGRDTVVVQVSSAGGALALVARVNFQPATFPTPEGYSPDSGALYSAARGYGWDVKLSSEAKTASTDPRLNSYVLVTNPAAAIWQMPVPSGTYLVTLACGSPTFTGQHRVEIEGGVVLDNVLTDTNQYRTVTDSRTTVSDGFLSVRIGGIAGSTKKTKLCYLVVQRLTSDPPGNAAPVVTASATPASGSAPLEVQFGGSATDPDGNSLAYAWSFGDGGSASIPNPAHTYAAPGTYAAIVTVSDGAGGTARDTVSVQATPADPGTSPLVRVNFQPASFPVPAGYTADSGDLYSAARGYGWDVRLSSEAKTANLDPRLNTYVYVTNPAAATWQMPVANGTYLVTAVCGSPTFTGQHRVVVEGTVLIDNVATGDNGFVSATDVPVTVTDGMLSVRIGGIAGSTKKTKLCYVHVAAAVPGKVLAAPARLNVLTCDANPARPGSGLRLATAGDGPARLEIFDVRGRRVRLLFEGRAPAGDLRLPWDGRDDLGRPLARGVYYVRAAVASHRFVLKLTLVR